MEQRGNLCHDNSSGLSRGMLLRTVLRCLEWLILRQSVGRNQGIITGFFCLLLASVLPTCVSAGAAEEWTRDHPTFGVSLSSNAVGHCYTRYCETGIALFEQRHDFQRDIPSDLIDGVVLTQTNRRYDAWFYSDQIQLQDNLQRNALIFSILFSGSAGLALVRLALLAAQPFQQHAHNRSDAKPVSLLRKVRIEPALFVKSGRLKGGLVLRF
jgi:hypothetical protein